MKCDNCKSCTKTTLYGDDMFLYCSLCKRVWKLKGRLPVEIFDGLKTEILSKLDLRKIE